MRHFAKSAVFVASLAFASAANLLAGQPATDPVGAYTSANGTMPGLKQLLPTFDFQGGSVTEFVDALRLAARPRELNIIILDPMSDTKIAPVKLRNISVESALQLLRGPLTSSPIDVTWIVPENFLDNPVVYIKRPNTVASEMAERAVQEQRRTTAVLSLELGLSKPGQEGNERNALAAMMLDAIDQALSFNPQAGKPNPMVRFHQNSGLVFVVGEPSQVAIAREVVSRISQEARDAQNAEAPKIEIAQLRRELDMLKAEDANAKADAASRVSVLVEMAIAYRQGVIQAVQSVLYREFAAGVAGIEILNEAKGLRITGPRELVSRAELVARGAKAAMARLPENLLQHEESAPSQPK